jgi:hypothetical protein
MSDAAKLLLVYAAAAKERGSKWGDYESAARSLARRIIEGLV